MQHQANKRKVFCLKELDFKGCLDFGYYNYHIAEPVLKTHRHDNSIEICYYLKGEQYYQIEDSIFKLKGNDFLIIPPNVPHGSGNHPENIGELFWLQISLCEEETLCFLPKKAAVFLIEALRKKEKQIFVGAYTLKPILEKILKGLENTESPFNKIYVNNLITRLLMETILLAQKTPHSSQITQKLSIIDAFINKNMDRQIYVDELAELLSFSTAYFKTWFKQNFGTPPKTYINRQKISTAKKMMGNQTNVTQIAYDLGFNSSQYFATVFKKHMGVTPKEYIKLHKTRKETT